MPPKKRSRKVVEVRTIKAKNWQEAMSEIKDGIMYFVKHAKLVVVAVLTAIILVSYSLGPGLLKLLGWEKPEEFKPLGAQEFSIMPQAFAGGQDFQPDTLWEVWKIQGKVDGKDALFLRYKPTGVKGIQPVKFFEEIRSMKSLVK